MAFMMPVMKNDWDIYNSQKSRKTSESAEKEVCRVRKVSESRSEGGGGRGSGSARALALSPHRSAPAMRALAYRAPRDSRASLRPRDSPGPRAPAAPPAQDKFHSRARAASPEPRSRCSACVPYL